MARLFASGDDDHIETGYTTNSDLQTWAVWTYRTGDGGGGKGRMWDKKDATCWLDNETAAGGEYVMQGNYSTKGYWRITRPSANAWHSIIVTYDSTSTNNDPIFYVDGTSSSVTEVITPSGSVVTDSNEWMIGNRGTAIPNRGWDGYLTEFAIWDRILSQAEVDVLADAYSAWFIPNGLVSYCPLIRDMIDYMNGTINDTGTADIAQPRIIYPTSKQVSRVNIVKDLLGGGIIPFAR